MCTLRLAKLLILFVALTSATAFGQQPVIKDTLLDHFAGRWVLQGTIAGSQTTHDVDAEWVLENQYIRLHEVSRERNSEGKPVCEAMVFVAWERASARYVCIWLDNTGVTSPGSIGTAKRSGDELPFLFQTKEGAFHTTFAYLSRTDSWEWRMDDEQNGALQPFARLTLTRQK